MEQTPFQHTSPFFPIVHRTFLEHVNHLEDNEAIHHALRVHLEKPVFDILRERYGDLLRAHWDTHAGFPTDGPCAILLYETRCHENLEFLIHNLHYFAPTFRLFFFCSPAVQTWVEGMLGVEKTNTVRFLPLPITKGATELHRNTYNDYIKSRDLWLLFADAGVEHVLVAQTDSYLRRPLLPAYFRDIDYAASMWPWNEGVPGGGGLSIRRVSKMLEILDTCPDIPQTQWPEDTVWSEGLKRIGGRYNPLLFTESALHKNPIGVHQWWTFVIPLTPEKLDYYDIYLTLDMDRHSEM